MPEREPEELVITVRCEECGELHPGEFSHFSEFGHHDAVYAVVCPTDWLTDYYTIVAAVVS
jgi:hypothetical protein